jgi:hypothetical protein
MRFPPAVRLEEAIDGGVVSALVADELDAACGTINCSRKSYRLPVEFWTAQAVQARPDG